jgi:hypothetical protein
LGDGQKARKCLFNKADVIPKYFCWKIFLLDLHNSNLVVGFIIVQTKS